jgi:hypothetical protein
MAAHPLPLFRSLVGLPGQMGPPGHLPCLPDQLAHTPLVHSRQIVSITEKAHSKESASRPGPPYHLAHLLMLDPAVAQVQLLHPQPPVEAGHRRRQLHAITLSYSSCHGHPLLSTPRPLTSPLIENRYFPLESEP